jgi:hypothetical protein
LRALSTAKGGKSNDATNCRSDAGKDDVMGDRQQIVRLAYQLESLLRTLSLAVDGQQTAGMSFEECGGGAVLLMAGDMAGEIAASVEKVMQ